MNESRFRAPGLRLRDLTGEPIFVACPRCSRRASVTSGSLIRPKQNYLPVVVPGRLTCLKCGLAKDRRPANYSVWGGPIDPFFELPLWFQADCCGGNTLWAFHERHLGLLEQFVAAKLRERGSDGLTMFARLPAWITAAKHRDEVLRTIARLRTSLGE